MFGAARPNQSMGFIVGKRFLTWNSCAEALSILCFAYRHIFLCVIALYISLLKAYTIVVLQVVYVVQLQPFAPPKGWS